VTPADRIHEIIMTPLRRCYPKPPALMRHSRYGGGRFLTAKETVELSMLDPTARAQLIARIVARMRAHA
jgi:hypothetical protein